MADTVIFCIEIKKGYGKFCAASNFITKMENGFELSEEEVRGIKNFLYKDRESLTYRKMAAIVAKGDDLKNIRHPSKLLAGIQDRQRAYCFIIEEAELDDVIELQYYCLMKKYYSNLMVGALIIGVESFYFKVSHYFINMSNEYKTFHDSILFLKNSRIQLLQIQNVQTVKNFVPIQYIDKITIQQLEKRVSEKITLNDMESFLNGMGMPDDVDFSPALKGCMDLLKNGFSTFSKMNTKKIAEVLVNGSILSFILFSYTFHGGMKRKNSKINENEEEWYLHLYRQVQECVICCQQLLENIVLHSMSGTGVISIRFLDNKSSYLQRYRGLNKNIPYVEIAIADYAGTNSSGNLAANFIAQINDNTLSESFHLLQPVDFLKKEGKKTQREELVEEAFTNYYSFSENIGRHFGLKIFKNVMEQNGGLFSFYSHNEHIIDTGESWGLEENKEENKYAQCMPGTAYSIVFPLEQYERRISRAQVSVDENIKLQGNIKSFLEDYICEDRDMPDIEYSFKTQGEKEIFIQKLAKELQYDFLDNAKLKIIYINAGKCRDIAAEFLCKALLIAGSSKKISDFVFYNCSMEFKKVFLQSISTYFNLNTMSYVFKDKIFRIVLFSMNPVEEVIIIPNSWEETLIANKQSSFAGGEFAGVKWIAEQNFAPENRVVGESLLPPYEILHKVELDGYKRTIFEAYTMQILETEIQKKEFGCKISGTHMRLGSTIHIDSFYEAELLFSNRLFISRFAYLLVNDIIKSEKFQETTYITLFSYALYSELLIFEMLCILEEIFPKKIFDYAILEREAEHRGVSHSDRIRYSNHFNSMDERSKHFQNSKVICIVPINSTLKTHEKLIDLLCKDNPGLKSDNIIMNFAIVLVGSKGENKYWKIDEKDKNFTDLQLNIKPIPRYFVLIKVDYQEALGCEMCFPKNPLHEIPLIEVNAASTIPNQSFGLYRENSDNEKKTYTWIRDEEKKLSALKNSLVYSHLQRGENHFTMYFKTDKIFLENKEDIKKWMKGLAEELKISDLEYHILVCPSHFSNAGFLEYLNKIVFHEAALIIRIDVDKEYRCNMEAKFSFIGEFLAMLEQQKGQKAIIKLYYIDDSIITGRTFQRAKSLIFSVMGIYEKRYKNLEINIFDKIFVLLDRNSTKTKMQYIESNITKDLLVGQNEENFYAFRTLNISSVRNHGDSCVICQLERQAGILYQSSATQFMAEHWKKEKNDFGVKFLSDKQHEEKLLTLEHKGKESDRAFRRMVCTHIVSMALNEKCHNNRKEIALTCLLELIIEDYNQRKIESSQEAFEYFLSYLKVTSRPFLSFSKAVREAIFDVLLILSEQLLNGTANFDSMCSSKPYLERNREQFLKIKSDIINVLTLAQKKDLLLLLMKQMMELRGNYFIRPENIRSLTEFITQFDTDSQKDIYNRYLWLVKKLVGISSDTSKSAWLNRMLFEADVARDLLGLPPRVYSLMVLENTRGYYDGLERLSETITLSENIKKILYEREESREKIGFMVPEDLKGEWNQLKDSINLELQKYQYRDFTEILADYHIDGKNTDNERQSISLIAGIEMLQLTGVVANRGKDMQVTDNIKEQCQKIACLMNKILHSNFVKLILELPFECDLWEDEFKERFNSLIPESMKAEYSLDKEEKKEYLVIADSGNKNYEADRLSRQEAFCLKIFSRSEISEPVGYKIDFEKRYFIWKIGNNSSRSIIIYAEFSKLEKFLDLQLFRNIMIMNHCFNEHIFNRKNSNHLYELMLAEKERLVYNTSKMETHTNDQVRSTQYADVKCESEEKDVYYPYYVMTLLADIQVSDVYRKSLHKDYYCRYLNLAAFKWNDTKIKFNGVSKWLVAGGGDFVKTHLNVHTDQMIFEDDIILEQEDTLIGYMRSSREEPTFLMILALIMNAAVGNRAKEDNYDLKKFIVDKSVYLTKTLKGDLRISNKLVNMYSRNELEQIRYEMEEPPGKTNGITIWSMSRYIKGFISVLLENSLLCMKKDISELYDGEKINNFLEQQKRIKILLSEDFRIRVNTQIVDGHDYFYIDIPVLAQKYNDYEEFFKRK